MLEDQTPASQPQIITPDSGPTSKESTSLVLTIILLFVGGMIGFLVGGSITSYLGTRGDLADVGLAGAYYIIFPIPVFAFLNVVAYRGIKSLNKVFKIIGYFSLFITIFSIVFSALLFTITIKEARDEISSIPSKVDFQIYEPSSSNPFSGLNKSHLPINEDIELRCRGVEYSFYGSRDGYSLIELKADEKGCHDFSYTNQENYEKALSAAEENITFGNNRKAVVREVNGETILLITEDLESSWLRDIYGVKGTTFIDIQVGSCALGTSCEDKFIEVYKSLKPTGG